MEELQQVHQNNTFMATQNPTTSQPQWSYHQMHPGMVHPQMQQQPQQQQFHQIPPQYPRSPSRAPTNQHTAQWMNQHYMQQQHQGWQQPPYASSPAPSVTPSLMSHAPYQDDRMSVLSVNTTMTAVPPDMDPSQRCFSSNGSTCENINPDMAMAQLTREVEMVLHNWFTIGDPVKRSELATKLVIWIKNKGMETLHEGQAQRCLQQLILVVINGLVSAHNPSIMQKEFSDVAYRMFELLHHLVARQANMMMLTQAFCMPSTDKQFSLKDAMYPFIDRIRDQKTDRMSHIAAEVIHLLIVQKDAGGRTHCLKVLKTQWFVTSLLKNLTDTPQTNWRIIYIIGMMLKKDDKMKEYMLCLGGGDKNQPNLVQIILENVLPKATAMPDKVKVAKVIRHACWMLSYLLIDENWIDHFITTMNGITKICHVIRTAYPNIVPPRDVVWEAFKLFEHMSDRPKFNDVDIPLAYIVHLIVNNEDWDIYKNGTGFLSNVVANKPKYKQAAIQCDCFQLLRHLIFRFPTIGDIPDGKRRLARMVMANIMRTLNNILPFWLDDKNRAQFAGMSSDQNNQINIAVNSFLTPEMLKLLMNMLVWEDMDSNNDDVLNIIELRNLLLRLIASLMKMVNMNRVAFFELHDDIRQENIVANAVYIFMSAGQACQKPCTKVGEKEEKDRQLTRSAVFIRLLVEFSANLPEVQKAIANCFRHKMSCPLELLSGSTLEPQCRVLLELCVLIIEVVGEIPPSWSLDRTMVETMANNRSAEIASAAQHLLGKMPVSTSFDPLADVFANSEYQFY